MVANLRPRPPRQRGSSLEPPLCNNQCSRGSMAFISTYSAGNLSLRATAPTARVVLRSERLALGVGCSGRSLPVASLAEHLPRTTTARAVSATATPGVNTEAARPARQRDGIGVQRRHHHAPRSPATTAGRNAAPAACRVTAAAAGVATDNSSRTPRQADPQRSSSFRQEAVTPNGGRRTIVARGERNAKYTSGRGACHHPSTGLREPADQRKATTTASRGTSSAEDGVLHQYDRYEEIDFRRRVSKMPRGAWQAVLRDLEDAEAAAAQALAAKGGLNAVAVAVGGRDINGGVGGGGTPVSLSMYTVCIRYMARERRGREAVRILGRVRAAGLEPDLRCLNFAISACGRAGLWEQALRILRGTDVENGGASTGAVVRDVYCWSSAVDACGRAGKWR